MSKRYIFLIVLLFCILQASSQMFILNEDFSGTSGTTPPAGWSSVVVSGSAEDSWHFDNPGDRQLNYPITEPFAIFDSDSTSADGQYEEVMLVTSLFDASTSNYILLNFVHVLDPGIRGAVRIEAYDGSDWQLVATYSTVTANPKSEIADLSDICGGITNARLRFIWTGNGKGFWAIDNIRIYASLPLDGGIVSLDNPTSPVVPGVQNVEITLGNFGYNTLTSTTINWQADGVTQTPYHWSGSIGFGQALSNIPIGTYNFQDPVMITVWQSNPNGQPDLNPYNDTISEYLVAPLCGNYTIGGTDPDFNSFTQVAEVLNTAGITCPVTFLVRDGTYLEEFEIGSISGSSVTNSITFRSESGDSTKAVIKIIPGALKYESMIYLNGTSHVWFKNLGLITGSAVSYSNNALLTNNASDIHVEGCYLEGKNQFDYGIALQGGSHNIEIKGNRFESISGRAGAINIYGTQTREIEFTGNTVRGPVDWGYACIRITDNAKKIDISGNYLERSFRGIYLEEVDSIRIRSNSIENTNEGIDAEDQCTALEISGNRFTNIKSHQNEPQGTSGIFIKNSTSTDIFNNFIHTTGGGPVMCIYLVNSTSCRISFNSTNTTNTEAQATSTGIYMTGNNQVVARDNIFRVKYNGFPIYVDDITPQLDFDKNDYFCPDNTIGYFNGTRYYDLTSWRTASGMDNNSLSIIPFYTSDTDLSINQALLNNTAIPVSGITTDIDGNPRNPSNPDIGAKEYNPCAPDAGINGIASPVNPLSGGDQQVSVLLQNQGSSILNSVQVNWSVNGSVQAAYPWSGNLPAGANIIVPIGIFNFQAGLLYTIKAWTTNPNNSVDCDPVNDTISSQQLAVPLCGDYTIGGSSPDFATITDAVNLLNLAGVTCPVTFKVRNGIYYEQPVFKKIPGTTAVNTVTFQSQSGDSTQAVIHLPLDALRYASMIYLDGSENLIFRGLGLFTGGDNSYTNNGALLTGCSNIRFENCYFESRRESDISIVVQGNCQEITAKNCRFESYNAKAYAIDISGPGTRAIEITDNDITGATDWNVPTIRFWNEVTSVHISGNHIADCFRAIYLVSSDTVLIEKNNIEGCNEGIVVDNFCSKVEISRNRLTSIRSHSNAPDGTNAISLNNDSQADIYDNFIHAEGNGPVTAINVQNSSQVRVNFNSVNITNDDVKDKSRGFYVKNTSFITAKNNIFTIAVAGVPVSISGTLNQFSFDRNDYYSIDHYIGYYNASLYSDLTEWQTATGLDANSLSVIPFYTTKTDLSINQVLLNNAGSPVSGVLTDIDGTVRDASNPDIGAKEFTPCATDAGINGIISPVNPLAGGTEEVKVQLQNQGTTALSSVTIGWKVNDELQSPFAWSGNLGIAANTEVVLANYNFQAGTSYIIKVWTSGPNSSQDCNYNNDTITSRELAGPLCGTYTVGGADGDFQTFSQVAEVLNTAGITCPITFLVRDGVYYDKIIISQVEGASEENTVTFRSESGDNTKAILKIEPTAGNYEPLIQLDNASHIIFRDMGLFTGASGSIFNYSVQMNGANDIAFSNCYFEIRNENDIGIDISGASYDVKIDSSRFECINSKAGAVNITDDVNHDISIQGNNIYGANNWGNTLIKTASFAQRITIEANHFERSFRSVYFIDCDTIAIRGNVIKSSNQGIYIDNQCSQVDISANRLTNIQSYANLPDGTSAIYVQNSTGTAIINNFVQTGGGGPVLAINLQNVNDIKVLFNSVNITNTDPQGKSKGLYIKAADSLLGRDNIFSIKTNGLPIHLEQAITNLNLDYNDYYSTAGIIGKVNDVTYSNLFDWGQTIQGDANSLEVNPYFKADTIPLPYQKSLNGAGIPISGVIYDIDGKLRHIQAPDIGCFEFFIDMGVLELLSPTLDCFHPNVDSVKVYIRQFGDVPFDNLRIAYKIDEIGVVHIDTIAGPITFDFIHTFKTTETLTAPGDYTFRIWLEGNTDDNINNDILVAKRYSKPPPTVSIDYDNECTGWEVNFMGTATIENPYYIAGYEWYFGDGDTSFVQNPVHLYTASGTYDVVLRAFSSAGCYSEITQQIVLNDDFQGLFLDVNLQDEICIGDGSGRLELSGNGGNPPYKYYVNGNLLDGNSITNLQPGIYACMVEDSKLCSRTDTVESSVLVNMDTKIQADPKTGLAPLTVEFRFTADGADSWTWHFPGDVADTTKFPTYTFPEYGYYTIILETNSGPPYNCIDTASVEIFADIIVTITANNVFTPNNDGYNDFFEIHSSGIESMATKIFNQWGAKVYETDVIDGKWDGIMKSGGEAPDGTYFWAIHAKGIDQEEYDREGSVLLLRHGAEASPNPVTDKVRVKVYETLQPPVTASVYSVFGQLAESEIINDTGNIVLDLSHLRSGIYIVRIDDGKKSSFVRIIKN
jgi:gliding motility-associated-like protein